MAASRNWCPALSAAPEVLQIGLSSPSKSDSPSPSRARPQSPKNKGSKAAALSVTTASNGTKLVDRVRQDRAFSNKVALSLATAEELASILSAAGETVDPASYVSHMNPDAAAAPGTEGQPLKLAAPLIVRNAAHLTDSLKPNADGTQLQPRNIVISDADLTTEALVGLVDGPIDQVHALTVQRSLHGTNSLAALCTALYGGAPPPEEPEPEVAVDPDEQGEEEAPVAKPPKPVWAPKKRSIQYLKLASNAVGFGAAAGEDPSAPALEELTKLIGQSSVAPIKHLSLSNCYLQSAGGAAVATAVLPSGTIETLDLSGNGIGKGDDGAATQAVAQLVQENKFLTSIDLSANDFDVAQSKQILEALANSKTRVATPEPNPEPEPEEYTDELPPEEEPPTVEIGFPADKEKEKEQGEGEESAPAEEGAAPEAAEPEPEAAPPAKGEDEGEEGEEEGEEEDEEPKQKAVEPAKKTVKIEEKPEEPPAEVEEDEEAAEERRRREEEKEEAEREALEAAKAAWAEKQEQYIWGPQRIHAEYGETVSRRVILKAHIDETTQLKSLERASRADAKKRQLHREKEDRERRSGWTHLKVLNFSGNPMGSVGAKAIADAIRKKIPLSEEEIQRAEEAADAFVAKATEAAEAAAAAKAEADKAAEEAARELAAKEAEEKAAAAKEEPPAKKQAAPAPPPPEDEGEENPEEGDGEAQPEAGDSLEDAPVAEAEAPQEEPPQEEAQQEEPQPAEDEPEQEEDAEQPAAEGGAPTAPAAVPGVPGIVRPKVEKDRDGIQTLQVLNLGSCGIGSKGLKALSTVLKDNNDSLKTLILKRNKFGVKHAEVPPPDAKEDDDPPKPMLRVDVTSWLSPGVQALSEALTINRTLTVLDLSYNNMYPTNLALLATGLQSNRTLEVLLLDGNHLNSSQLLLQIVQAIGGEDSAITTLGLSSAGIEGALTRDVAMALTNCQALRSLNLDSNGLTAVEASNLSSAIADAPPSFRLRALSVQNNSIYGLEGGVALGSIAKLVSTLQSLRISGNAELGDEAFAEVCNLISNHSALKVLSASRIGITTIAPLTTVAASIGMLTMVELADNEINPESVIRFAQEVRRMSAISFISVWGRTVDIESAAMRDFVEAAKACPTLFQVDLGQGLGAATAPPTPPDPSEDPPQTEDDLLSDGEKLEKYCFRNRLLSAVQGQ